MAITTSNLEAKPREGTGKGFARRTRLEGQIPRGDLQQTLFSVDMRGTAPGTGGVGLDVVNPNLNPASRRIIDRELQNAIEDVNTELRTSGQAGSLGISSSLNHFREHAWISSLSTGRLTQTGIPVMGHIGLTPQSVHQQGGYYVHGKTDASQERLMKEAKALEAAGAFSLVLECVEENLATKISEELSIPTIGIGSGKKTDGQVLVVNDLLKMGPKTPPKFCPPIADFYQMKKDLIAKYLKDQGK